MMGQLEGKVAVVTGGAAGIGAGLVEAFAEAGADVATCDIQADKLHGVAERVAAATGRRVEATVADVRDPAAVKAFVDGAAETLGGIDLVVANAGVWKPTDPLVDDFDTALADWALMVDTNLRGVFATGRAAIPHLIARGGGDIVNIATDHIFPPPGAATGGGTRMDVYDSSKWGINGLTQSWSKRLAGQGIRVNALCLDAVDSEMVRLAAGDRVTPEMVAEWMTPAQIARLLLDLLAEGPDGRTGENIGAWRGHPVELPPRAEVLPSRHR
jgi:NAD(P)-dependent dehydrogenase (short-subunit alcohol dehydrogenase family)